VDCLAEAGMGCCSSAHAEAAETDLPPPMFGKDIRVRLKRGWYDFNIYDLEQKGEDGKETPAKWMLLDAVGGWADDYFDYFVKYRPTGLKESITLGCANLKKDHDYMWQQVTYAHQRSGRHRSTYNKRRRHWTDKQVNANFIIARRCRLFADRGQTKLIGRLQIAGSGTFSRHYHHESWMQKVITHRIDDAGNRHREVRWVHRSRTTDNPVTNLQHFYHTMNAYGTDYNIQYTDQSSKDWMSSDSFTFEASSDTGMPLFRVVSDGVKDATVQTFSSSDPINAILAAFAVSIKMEPREFYKNVCSYTERRISLNSHTGLIGGFGLNDAEYEAANPTPGEWTTPPAMGFNYGFDAAAATAAAAGTPVTFAVPVAAPIGKPFTPMFTHGVVPFVTTTTTTWQAPPPMVMPTVASMTPLMGDTTGGATAIVEADQSNADWGEGDDVDLSDGDDDDPNDDEDVEA